VVFTVNFANSALIENVAIRVRRNGSARAIFYAAGTESGTWTHNSSVTTWSVSYTIPPGGDGDYEITGFVRINRSWH